MCAEPLVITNCRLEVPGIPRPSMADFKIIPGFALFEGHDLRAKASVFMGVPTPGMTPLREHVVPRPYSSPIGARWRAFWVQLCCQEEVWALYRGKDPADGTIRVRWPSFEVLDREHQNDYEVLVSYKDKFYKELSQASSVAELEFVDIPQQKISVSLQNTVTLKPNHLAVAVIRLSFILAVAARDPDDHLHVLKSVYWWLRWESTFRRSDGPDPLVETRILAKTEGGKGNPQDGAPAKLAQALRAGPTANANIRAQEAEERSYPRWQDLGHLYPLPGR